MYDYIISNNKTVCYAKFLYMYLLYVPTHYPPIFFSFFFMKTSKLKTKSKYKGMSKNVKKNKYRSVIYIQCIYNVIYIHIYVQCTYKYKNMYKHTIYYKTI